MEQSDISDDLTTILVTEQEIRDKLAELARQIETDYAGKDVLLAAAIDRLAR